MVRFVGLPRNTQVRRLCAGQMLPGSMLRCPPQPVPEKPPVTVSRTGVFIVDLGLLTEPNSVKEKTISFICCRRSEFITVARSHKVTFLLFASYFKAQICTHWPTCTRLTRLLNTGCLFETHGPSLNTICRGSVASGRLLAQFLSCEWDFGPGRKRLGRLCVTRFQGIRYDVIGEPEWGGIRPWIDLLFIYLRVAVRAHQIADKVA